MKYLIKTFLLAACIFVLTVNAQDDKDYVNEPGFVDFGKLTSFYKGDDITEIFLDEHLLKMMSRLSGENEPGMKNLLSGLKLVKVYSFMIEEDVRINLKNRIGEIDKKLLSKKWYRIIKVKKKKEYTNVYLKSSTDENNIVGLAVVSLDDNGEVSFINIVGNINLDNLGRLSDQFNIPMMFNKHHKKKVIKEKKIIKEKKK